MMVWIVPHKSESNSYPWEYIEFFWQQLTYKVYDSISSTLVLTVMNFTDYYKLQRLDLHAIAIV